MELGLQNNLGKLTSHFNHRRLLGTSFVGKSRTGKTTALTRIALDDIYQGQSIVFFGNTVLKHIPEERQEHVTYFHPEYDHAFGFNVLHGIKERHRPLFVNTFLDTVRGLWQFDGPTPNIDMYTRATLSTLLSNPKTTLLSMLALLSNEAQRKAYVGNVENAVLQYFWDCFNELKDTDQRQSVASTLNKVYAFLLEPIVCNCLAQRANHLTFRDKITIINLPRTLGQDNARLLGALVLTQLYIEGISGLETNLFVDDAEPYAPVLTRIIEDCPGITVQFAVGRFSPLVEKAGTVVAFRTSIKDARQLEPEFGITENQGGVIRLYELPPFQANVSHDGTHTRLTMPVHGYPLTPKTERKIIERCQSQYTTPREDVERKIGTYLRGLIKGTGERHARKDRPRASAKGSGV